MRRPLDFEVTETEAKIQADENHEQDYSHCDTNQWLRRRVAANQATKRIAVDAKMQRSGIRRDKEVETITKSKLRTKKQWLRML